MGAVLGALVVIFGLTFGFFCLRRRKVPTSTLQGPLLIDEMEHKTTGDPSHGPDRLTAEETQQMTTEPLVLGLEAQPVDSRSRAVLEKMKNDFALYERQRSQAQLTTMNDSGKSLQNSSS